MMILALVLIYVGCAKPPEAEKAAAKTAMDAAVAAGAEKYAIADFAAAKSLWAATETKLNEKKYDEAKQGYISVKPLSKGCAAAHMQKAMTDELSPLWPLRRNWKKSRCRRQGCREKMQTKGSMGS